MAGMYQTEGLHKNYKVPFDVGGINHHIYDSNLNGWIIGEEIKKLTAHILECVKNSPDHNRLWEVFGMQVAAESSESTANMDTLSLDLINLQLTHLHKKVDGLAEQKENPKPMRRTRYPSVTARIAKEITDSVANDSEKPLDIEILQGIQHLFTGLDPSNEIVGISFDEPMENVYLNTVKPVTDEAFIAIKEMAGSYGMALNLDHLDLD
jgi:hypothetical protein